MIQRYRSGCRCFNGLIYISEHSIKLWVLSHLVRLPGPNQNSFAPPSPCWTVFILVYLGPNRGSFVTSSQQPLTPLLSNEEKAAKGITLLSALLYIYVFEPFVLFTKLSAQRHLRLSYECIANALKQWFSNFYKSDPIFFFLNWRKTYVYTVYI